MSVILIRHRGREQSNSDSDILYPDSFVVPVGLLAMTAPIQSDRDLVGRKLSRGGHNQAATDATTMT